jgi:hypothetical protein
MAAPTPTSTARLDALPVARLLAHGLERRFTGTVVIEAPERHRSAIYFEQGAPAKVKSGLRVHLLGELLAELGLADGTAVEAALARAVAERRLLGQVLLADGRLTRSISAPRCASSSAARSAGWRACPGRASRAGTRT